MTTQDFKRKLPPSSVLMHPRVTVAGALKEEKQEIRGLIVSKNQTYISCKYFHSEICPHKDHEAM